jgi:hypothetical protein
VVVVEAPQPLRHAVSDRWVETLEELGCCRRGLDVRYGATVRGQESSVRSE